MYDAANPLIVQADRSIYLETFNPRSEEARAAISPFAELEKSPEHLHTYKLTPLSLWNAASSGQGSEVMVEALVRFSKFPVPENVITDIRELVGRWGRLRLVELGPLLALEVQPGDEGAPPRAFQAQAGRAPLGRASQQADLRRAAHQPGADQTGTLRGRLAGGGLGGLPRRSRIVHRLRGDLAGARLSAERGGGVLLGGKSAGRKRG